MLKDLDGLTPDDSRLLISDDILKSLTGKPVTDGANGPVVGQIVSAHRAGNQVEASVLMDGKALTANGELVAWVERFGPTIEDGLQAGDHD